MRAGTQKTDAASYNTTTKRVFDGLDSCATKGKLQESLQFSDSNCQILNTNRCVQVGTSDGRRKVRIIWALRPSTVFRSGAIDKGSLRSICRSTLQCAGVFPACQRKMHSLFVS
jgi:hypothetical protein